MSTLAPEDSAGVVRFVLDSELVTVRDLPPTTTVLEYLREVAGRTGTKEGCAEGDCGACTIVLGELTADGQSVSYNAVNSCIRFLPTIDGKELVTVESLQSPGGELHPVQQAMVECHASQCGFCTPGFVMSLFALCETELLPARARIDDVLSGNLCRCTGYRPIVAAAERAYAYGAGRARAGRAPKTVGLLESIARRDTLTLEHQGRRFFAPRTIDALAALVERHPDAHLLA